MEKKWKKWFKSELGGQIMIKFVGWKTKTCSYLKDNIDEDKRTKGTKKYVIKRKLKFKEYKKMFKSIKLKIK